MTVYKVYNYYNGRNIKYIHNIEINKLLNIVLKSMMLKI